MAFNSNRRINLEALSDEQLENLMNSVDKEIDFSSDDSDLDPTYDPDEISPEDDKCIFECIKNMDESTLLSQAINMSISVSEFEVLPGSSPIVRPVVSDTIDNYEPVKETATEPTSMSNETSAPKKPPKRPRSPLPIMEATGSSNVRSAGGFISADLESIKKDAKEFVNIIWRKKSLRLHVNDVAFQGDSSLPSEIKDLETPMQIFMYFFTSDVVGTIVAETNEVASAENINNPLKVTNEEFYHYIGILLYMSVYRYPNIESYWGKNA